VKHRTKQGVYKLKNTRKTILLKKNRGKKPGNDMTVIKVESYLYEQILNPKIKSSTK